VVEAYRKIGLRAIQDKFLLFDGGSDDNDYITGCCGLSAVAIADGGDDNRQDLINDLYDAPDEAITKALGLSNVEMKGWIKGFDHRMMLTEIQLRQIYPGREWEEYRRWYSCGWASYDAVLEAGLTATPEANETDDEGEGND
jgi:hypothetical protein